MRKAACSIVLTLLTVLSAIVLGVASVTASAISAAVTALIVPGTGTNNADSVQDSRKTSATITWARPTVRAAARSVAVSSAFHTPLRCGRW